MTPAVDPVGVRDLEELAVPESEPSSDHIRRELLNPGVEIAYDRIVVAAGVLQRVLDLRERLLELREVLRCAELGIRFGQGEQPAQRGRQRPFRLTALGRSRTLGRHGPIPCGDHRFEGLLLVAGVALHGFDDVRDEIRAPFELDVDIGPGVVGLDVQPDEPVVDADDGQGGRRKDHEDDNQCHRVCAPRRDASRASYC
jgi:hypothetical protein